MSKKIESYQKAIRVIQDMSSGELSTPMVEDIILKIAEIHPEVLVRAADSIRSADTQFGRLSPQTIESTINDFLNADRKISAIKFLRSVTGLGLRQAKDEIDGYERRLGMAGRFNADA